MKKLLFISLLFVGFLGFGQKPAYLVKNTAPTTILAQYINAWGKPIVFNNNIYFSSLIGTGPNDQGLWKTDGSQGNRKMVIGYFNMGDISEIIDVNGTLYFSTNIGNFFKSNGTTAGTELIKSNFLAGSLIKFNNQVFFTHSDIATGLELWKSDGTDAGTVMVKDIEPGSANSFPQKFTVSNGSLYFAKFGNTDLWKTDGTTAGTVLVKSMSGIGELIDINGTLFFNGGTVVNNVVISGLWKSDGTTAGTVLVSTVQASQLANINGTLFFRGGNTNSPEGAELWKSDGTALGTVLVKDINIGPFGSNPEQLTNVNGTLFFVASTATEGAELWKSNGTTAGTVLVKDIDTRVSSGGNPVPYGSNISSMTNLNGVLMFSAHDSNIGDGLWRSDGTTAGTNEILGSGSRIYSPLVFVQMNGILFFIGSTPTTNSQAEWRSDGTAAGTFVVDDRTVLLDYGGGTVQNQPVAKGNEVFYPSINNSFWKSDGTSNGTVNVKNNVNINEMLTINNTIFLAATDGITGLELWKSDGTTAGTVLVKDIYPGSSSSLLSQKTFTNVNGVLFFVAGTPNESSELWKSDGTTTGTVLVKDINVGTSHSNINELTVMNGIVYFRANDGINGPEIWRSDGTAAGTYMVKETIVGSGSESPIGLVVMNNNLYYNSYGNLWRSDGTAAGTMIIYTFASNQGAFTNIGSTNNLLFMTHDQELWRSDGTNAGTFLIKSGNIFGENSGELGYKYNPAINSTFYFRIYDSTPSTFIDVELWKTDGTVIGTVLVKLVTNLRTPMRVIGNELYFTGGLNFSGIEILKTDGTTAGTVVVANMDGGAMNSIPRYFTQVGNKLFFAAAHYLVGGAGLATELYKIDIACTSTPLAPTASGATIPINTRTTLTANCPTGETQWYTQTTGNEVLFTGGTFTTPFLNASKTYYVGCETNLQCQSARTQVVVTINVPCTQMVSVKTGAWNDPTVWSCNRIPTATDNVIVETGHLVTVPAGTFQVKNVTDKGTLGYALNGILNILGGS